MANVTVDSSLLDRMTKYVAATQPLIEKAAHQEAACTEKAAAAVETLIKQGLLNAHLRDAKVRELSSDPVAALDSLKKTAGLVGTGAMGGPVAPEASKSSASEADLAFEQRLLGGR